MGRKLKTYDTGYPHLNEKNKKWEALLEKYLETENPDYLIEAFRVNPKLKDGKAQYLKEKRESQSKPASKYVDPYTIVWETRIWWFQYHNFCVASQKVEKVELGQTDKVDSPKVIYSKGTYQWILRDAEEEKEKVEIVKRYLSAIGAADYSQREEWIEIKRPDGLKHILTKKKGTNNSLTYTSPEEFIEIWNPIMEAFRKSRLKKRYKDTPEDQRLLRKHLAEELPKHLKGEETYPDSTDIVTFKLKTIKSTTASFIVWRHVLSCPICKRSKRTLSPEKIEDLYKKALKELNQPIYLPRYI